MSAAQDPRRVASILRSNDSEKSTLGDDDDVSFEYDESKGANGAFVIGDEQNNDDVLEARVGGDVHVPSGRLGIQTTPSTVFDTSGVAEDWRIRAGHGIQDDSGTGRLTVFASRTDVNDDSGTPAFQAQDGSGNVIYAESGQPAQVFDRQQSGTAVQYDTGASLGTFDLKNSVLTVKGGTGNYPSDGFHVEYDGTQTRLRNRNNGSTPSSIDMADGRIDISTVAQDLRLATGQAIEDGSGNPRLEALSGFTAVRWPDGTEAVTMNSGTELRIRATSTEPIVLYDGGGGFDAVKYTTSASAPGTLELKNAHLVAKGPEPSTSGLNAKVITIPPNGGDNTDSRSIQFENSNSNNAGLQNEGGELIGVDSAGNSTTLT